MPNRARTKVFFDGGCRPNPGMMECAVVTGGTLHLRTDLGVGNSHDAEWLALIEALHVARRLALADFVLLGDALAVIGPASGKVKPAMAALGHLATYRALAATGPAPALRYVPRAQNLAGIALNRRYPR